MKTISTLVTLMFIALTCATSAVLYLNENYNLSAFLTFGWVVALTLWIGKSVGFVDQVLNKYFVRSTK
jgi:hypothetical protein